jgi:hypothetical protein
LYLAFLFRPYSDRRRDMVLGQFCRHSPYLVLTV